VDAPSCYGSSDLTFLHFLHTGERMGERSRMELPDLCLDPRVVEVITVLEPLRLNCYCISEQRCSKNIFFLIPLNLLNWTNLYACAVVHVFTQGMCGYTSGYLWLEDLVLFPSADRPTPPNTLSHSNGAANSWKSGTERRLGKVAEQCRPCSV